MGGDAFAFLRFALTASNLQDGSINREDEQRIVGWSFGTGPLFIQANHWLGCKCSPGSDGAMKRAVLPSHPDGKRSQDAGGQLGWDCTPIFASVTQEGKLIKD